MAVSQTCRALGEKLLCAWFYSKEAYEGISRLDESPPLPGELEPGITAINVTNNIDAAHYCWAEAPEILTPEERRPLFNAETTIKNYINESNYSGAKSNIRSLHIMLTDLLIDKLVECGARQ